MKKLIWLLLVASAFGQSFNGGTVGGNILPDTTGRNLGSPTQRWNGFFQNLDVSTFTAPFALTATPVNRQYSVNQSGLSSMYVDWARPSCTGPAQVGFMAAFSVHAEDTPTYDATLSSSTPCQTVALFSTARRSGTRSDQIWGFNPVVAYNNAGSAQGIEIDVNNFYQDYVIGGADTNSYAGIAVITQGSFQPDKAIVIDRTGIAGLWRRGLYINAVSDRAIEFNGTPTYALYADNNMTNFISGTWTWKNDASTHPLHGFTPFADDANTELYGTNAANTLVKWSISNLGQGIFAGFTLPAVTDQAVGRATTDNLTGKTFSVATGTPPFAVTSTTPVANLSATPTTYNAAGTQQVNTHLVWGTCTLGTSCAITLAGGAIFTSNTSYDCFPRDNTTPANAVTVVRTSGTALSFTGTGTDVVNYQCVGN